jgi:hypothetical protein
MELWKNTFKKLFRIASQHIICMLMTEK